MRDNSGTLIDWDIEVQFETGEAVHDDELRSKLIVMVSRELVRQGMRFINWDGIADDEGKPVGFSIAGRKLE